MPPRVDVAFYQTLDHMVIATSTSESSPSKNVTVRVGLAAVLDVSVGLSEGQNG